MADRVILNQAAIDAANRANAEIDRQKIAAGQTIKKLEPEIAGARQFVNVELPQTERLSAQYAANNPDYIERYLINRILPESKTKGAGLIESVINPYDEALGALNQKYVPVPAPVYDTSRSSNVEVLKSILRGMGFNSSIIDASSTFLLELLKDGLDYDNAVAIFLNSKEYTTAEGKKLESPFYKEYGYLNEGLTSPKGAAELYNAVEGYKEVKATFNLSDKFISREYLQGYIKNNKTVAQFSRDANLARLKAVNADAAYTDSLKRLGFITEEADLTDFFLDPKVGEETLNQRKVTAALGSEAIKRASQGLQFSTTRFNQIAAGMLGLGLSAEEGTVRAAQGMENIAESLLPTTKLTQIYDKASMQDEALRAQVQSELEAEEYTGLSSERRKRVKELETRAYQAQAGIYRGGALRKAPTAGAI